MASYRKALIGKKKFEKKESWPELIKTDRTSGSTQDHDSTPGPSSQLENPQELKNVLPKKGEKRKFKKPSSQINIDLFQAVQNALQAKKAGKTSGVRKRSKVTEKGGNRLDSDRPTLHKGKVRMKKKRPTVAKRCFLLARNLPKNKSISPSILNLRNEISRLKLLDVATLSQTLEKVKIDGTETLRLSSIPQITSQVVHTNKFKGYCQNCVSDDLKKSVRELITMLRKFQDKLHARDEIKAHAKRRYVCGIKESKKFVLCNKAKCLIVATDLEIEGGFPSNDILETLVDAADLKDVPVIFCALSKELGYWTLKKRKISVLAVLDYDGANEVFKQMIQHWEKGRMDYANVMKTTNEFFTSKKDGSTIKDVDIESEIRDQMILKLTDVQTSDERD